MTFKNISIISNEINKYSILSIRAIYATEMANVYT
jgi:hypothetical protein